MSDRTFTAEEKLKAVERELGLRRKVYPRRIAGGYLRQEDADFQLAIFEAIRSDYEKLARQERLL